MTQSKLPLDKSLSYRNQLILLVIMACGRKSGSCRVPQILNPLGTVVCMIWWKLILIAAYAGLIVSLELKLDVFQQYAIPHTFHIMDIIGVVTGLLLVFRTNTAYERFWEGQKLWSEMVSNIRIITRTIWVMVKEKNDSEVLIGKISALNLLVAFAYATKHYLREEYSREEIDLKGFVQHLPSFSTPSSNEPLARQEESDADLPSRGPHKRHQSKVSKELREVREAAAKFNKHVEIQAKMSIYQYVDLDPISSNIPLEISFYLTAYVVHLKKQELIDSPTCRVIDTALGAMVKCLTGFERIRRTPIPKSYSVHLTHIAWIVILCLPFQLYQSIHWYTIGVTVLAGFAFLGILSIGNEIENPFGYGYNNLHLDDFCHVIQKEVIAIMGRPVGEVSVWMQSRKSFPIVTHPDLSARDLAEMNVEDIHGILAEGVGYNLTKPSRSVHSNVSHSSSNKVRDIDHSDGDADV